MGEVEVHIVDVAVLILLGYGGWRLRRYEEELGTAMLVVAGLMLLFVPVAFFFLLPG